MADLNGVFIDTSVLLAALIELPGRPSSAREVLRALTKDERVASPHTV